MKILHVVTDIQISSGGVAAAACGMVEAVVARGHDVTIACLNRGGTPLQPQGVTVQAFAPDRNSSLLPSAKLRDYLQENIRQFAVVHIHGVWQHPGHYAAAAARQHKIPYVLAPHGMLDANSLAMGRRWAKSMAWFLWDSTMVYRAAAVHCLNAAEIKCSPALRKTPNAIIGNGIARAALDNMPVRGLWRKEMGGSIGDQGRPIALFLSRIHPKKGLERLLPYWPELLKRHPTLLLVIAGTGEPAHVQRVQEVARQHGLINSVLFVGQLSGAAKSQAMADADVFILPSYQEGFSMAIAEAMAAGLPVVITRECNFGEVEEVEAGAVIAHGDMPAFVGAVAKLLENPTARFISGRNGQRLVRSRFSWEAAAERLEQLYRAVSQRSQIPQNLMPPEISRASDSTAD